MNRTNFDQFYRLNRDKSLLSIFTSKTRVDSLLKSGGRRICKGWCNASSLGKSVSLPRLDAKKFTPGIENHPNRGSPFTSLGLQNELVKRLNRVNCFNPTQIQVLL
ncbi:MAG: hypothetical protein MHPSP_002065 [Paramarteilia canceri]